MDREQTARNKHKNGFNCANAVYSTFEDKVTGEAPRPRSEDGKCGAVLAGEKIMRQLGMDAAAFDERFLEKYGSLKCAELRKGKYPCNDMVGTAAHLVETLAGI